MSAQEILSEIRNLGGRLEARGDRLHVAAPTGSVTPELKARLAEHKTALLRVLLAGDDELKSSRDRLAAENISIAVLDDGDCRIVQGDVASAAAMRDGYAVYSPADAYFYVRLSEHERAVMRGFKRRFPGATWNWRDRL